MLGGGGGEINETCVSLPSQMNNCEVDVLHNLEPFSMPSTAVLANTPTGDIFVSITHTNNLSSPEATTCMQAQSTLFCLVACHKGQAVR